MTTPVRKSAASLTALANQAAGALSKSSQGLGKTAKALLSAKGQARLARRLSSKNETVAGQMSTRYNPVPPRKTGLGDRKPTSGQEQTFAPGKQPAERAFDPKLQIQSWHLENPTLLGAAGLSHLAGEFLTANKLTDQQATAIAEAMRCGSVGDTKKLGSAAQVFVLLPSGELQSATPKILKGLPAGSTIISTNDAGAELLKSQKTLGLEPGAFAYEVADRLKEIFGKTQEAAAQCERTS